MEHTRTAVGRKPVSGPQTPPGSLLSSFLSFLLMDLALGSRGETWALCPVLGQLLPPQVSPLGIRRVAEAGNIWVLPKSQLPTAGTFRLSGCTESLVSGKAETWAATSSLWLITILHPLSQADPVSSGHR